MFYLSLHLPKHLCSCFRVWGRLHKMTCSIKWCCHRKWKGHAGNSQEAEGEEGYPCLQEGSDLPTGKSAPLMQGLCTVLTSTWNLWQSVQTFATKQTLKIPKIRNAICWDIVQSATNNHKLLAIHAYLSGFGEVQLHRQGWIAAQQPQGLLCGI